MKVHKVLIFIALLVGASFADYDDDRTPKNKDDWEKINQTMSTAHKSCYKFVTPLRKKDLEHTSEYPKSLELIRWVTEAPDSEIYRDYLGENLGKAGSKDDKELRWNVWAAFMGLKNVQNLVYSKCLHSILMVISFVIIRFVKPVRELLAKNIKWTPFSVLIPAILAFTLLPQTFDFINASDDAQRVLRVSETWNRDFQTHHTTWVNKKTEQFQCVANQYWKGLYQFKYMAGPFFVYRDALLMTENVIGKFTLEEFIKKYRGYRTLPDKKHDDVFYSTYYLEHAIHMKISKTQPWGADEKMHQLRDMFENYYSDILQLPTQAQFYYLNLIIVSMSIFTIVAGAGVAVVFFMDEPELQKMMLRILKWTPNVIICFVVVKTAIFSLLLAQVAGAYTVQNSLLDVNAPFLNGLHSSKDLDLGKIFRESQNPDKTLIEMVFNQRYIFDARPEIFRSPNVTFKDFEVLRWVFLGENITKVEINKANVTIGKLVNIGNFYRGVAERLHFETKEDPTFFPFILFGLNYNRFATSLVKDVIIPVSATIWPLMSMGIVHFAMMIWVLYALPHAIKHTEEQLVGWRHY